MIAFVQGQLIAKELTRATVAVQGIGFDVQIPLSTYDKLPAAGAEAHLYTVLHVREDAMQLFGFATTEERELFNLLVEVVAGVGPRLALNVLSGMSVGQFCAAVANNDARALAKLNGIGKRTAERLVVELRDKLAAKFPQATLDSRTGTETALSAAAEDTVKALVGLGYKVDVSRRLVAEILGENPTEPSAEKLLRLALARMQR